jgi:hypothetical protein
MSYHSRMARRKLEGKTKETVNIMIHGLRPPRPKKREGDRRGKNPDFIKNQFKAGKGENLDPRTKRGLTRISQVRQAPRVPKFSDMYSVAMMDKLDARLCKKYGLPVGTTMLDLIINRVVEEAAHGSLEHVQEIREVCQGKVPNKNLNVTAELEAYVDNPEFRQFMSEKLQEFLATRPQQRLTTGDAEI